MKIGRFIVPTGNTMVTLEGIELTREELLDVKEILVTATAPTAPRVSVSPVPIDCDYTTKCIDHWGEKCSSCKYNRAKSYYEKKEVG